MEETDLCPLIPDVRAFQTALPNGCLAHALPPSERLTIGLHALAGKQSITSVHNIVHAVIDQARPYNGGQDLAPVANAGLDEIYQHGQPVLVGADIASTYCFLLSLEEHADADTWAIHLFEARDHGLAPQAFVADFGAGIRAGHQLAF